MKQEKNKGILLCHIDKALDHMDKFHEKTDNEIIYVPDYGEPEFWAVLREGKGHYGHRQVLKIAYLFADGESPDEGEKFSKDQMSKAESNVNFWSYPKDVPDEFNLTLVSLGKDGKPRW